MSTLEVHDLRTAVIGPISLRLEPAECAALTGPSGAGKTLMLRALADLDPHEGRITLGGRDCKSFDAPHWRRKVGWLPAESAWWAETAGAHFDAAQNPWLEPLGFAPEVMGWKISRLSTGERQRLALARMLAVGPEVLLLDEPTASLDPANVRTVERIILEYRAKRGAALLWVSHDPDQIRRVARHRYQIERGLLREEAMP